MATRRHLLKKIAYSLFAMENYKICLLRRFLVCRNHSEYSLNNQIQDVQIKRHLCKNVIYSHRALCRLASVR